jgi:hypothetical protein
MASLMYRFPAKRADKPEIVEASVKKMPLPAGPKAPVTDDPISVPQAPVDPVSG